MNAWLAASPCTSRCAIPVAAPVPAIEVARRYAAAARVLTVALARVPRLVDPAELRTAARRLLRALGVGLYTDGMAFSSGGRGTLVVANHISWLDVVVMSACEPMTQLAKREITGWPVIGSTARRLGTLFIDRDTLWGLPGTVETIADALRAGRSVLAWPQATTWCTVSGGRFHRAVFQAAVDAGAPVRPVTIDYYQYGTPTTIPAFLGDDDILSSLRRIAAAGGVSARVRVHPAIEPGVDRRGLAKAAQDAVFGAAAMSPPAHARTPERGPLIMPAGSPQ